MASRSITVNPAKMKSVSEQIKTLSNEYKKQYEQLFNEVNAMASAWKGADNIAYTTQIEGFREDFELMYKLMINYTEFLDDSAKIYQMTQDEVASQAKRLTN